MDDRKYWKNHSLLPRSCWSLESSEFASLDYRMYCCRRCSSLARRQHVVGGKRCLLAVEALSYIQGVPHAQCPHLMRVSYGRRGRGMALSAQGLTGRILRWLSSYGVQMKWLRESKQKVAWRAQKNWLTGTSTFWRPGVQLFLAYSECSEHGRQDTL